MSWWRRDEPLHEKLAREGDLSLDPDESERTRPPWDKAGIHGMPRPRRWDAVATATAPDVPGDELSFVSLTDGTLILEGDGPDDAQALAPLIEAIEDQLDAPYRAEAVRRTDEVWALAARTIEVAELPAGTPGESLTFSVQGGEQTTLVDGEEWLASLPALEALADDLDVSDYVVEASRLDGDLWEVRVSPL